MIDWEKLLDGLEYCQSAYVPDDCERCPYGDCWNKPHTLRITPEVQSEILDYIQPRVMTLDEVKDIVSIRDGVIWLQAYSGIMPAIMEFANNEITCFVAIPLTGYRGYFENAYYGKTWICWTGKPTIEQRRNIQWQTL